MSFLFLVLITVPVAALTGGIASALVGGGHEDHTIVQNWAIGFLGWTVAMLVFGA